MTSPDATTTAPSNVTPNQNTSFSPALKRCEGGSRPADFPIIPPPFSSQPRSPRCGQLCRRNVKNTTASDTANRGPAKLCSVFSAYVNQPKACAPSSGSSRNLPKAMTSPDTASTQNAMAFDQCADRSKG